MEISEGMWKFKVFSIGAILDKNDEETEISFLSAIERANIHERELSFNPIVRYLVSEDASAVEKIFCTLIAENVIAIFGPTTKRTAGECVVVIVYI